MRREMVVGLFANGPTELDIHHVDRGFFDPRSFRSRDATHQGTEKHQHQQPHNRIRILTPPAHTPLSHTSNRPQIILSDPEAGLLAGVLHGCRASSGTSRGIQSMP
jgi:hypothetical protein